MSTPLEDTYGNIQKEERYKKLERTLKIFLLNQKKSSHVNSPDSAWPSVSCINGDPLDTSCAGYSVHSSQVGSDVLASSRNMRKMIQSRSNLPDNPQKMMTSSVKQFPTNNDQAGRVLMPPPKSIHILAHSSRRNSLVGPGLPKSTPHSSSGTNNGFSAQSHISSIKDSSSGKDMLRIEFEKENCRDHQQTIEMKPDRIFSKWRPVLNDKSQLIIKGTLECGKVARSKPVIRRLSSVSVQSVFNHIYHLHGNIYDERHELPDYIRGKFYNGFPDDWENVYQVWRNFVAGGSSESFRWPTPVTDSDDDLKSEITDVLELRKPRKRLHSARDVKELPEDGIRLSPRKHSSSITRREHFPEEILRENNSLTPRKRLNSSKDRRDGFSEGLREDKKLLSPRKRPDSSRDRREVDENNLKPSGDQNKSCCCTKELNSQYEAEDSNNTIENFMDKIKNTQMNSSSASLAPSNVNKLSVASLKNIIHEDKLNIILENLTSKRCSIEYIDKMLEMFDCLKYVMSYQSDDSASDPFHPFQAPQASKTSCAHRDTPFPQESHKNPPKSSNPPPEIVPEIYIRKRNIPVRRKLSKDDYDSSDSLDSEEERRPKLPLRPLKHQEKPLDQLRSTEKRRIHPESTVSESEDEITSPKKKFSMYPPQPRAEVNDHKTQKKIFKMPRPPLMNYDSCVSLTEDERRPTKPPLPHLKSRERPLQHRDIQSENYDSSVSITEDEFGDNPHRRAEAKRQILQEANAKLVKHPDDCIKQSHLKGMYQRDLSTISEKTKKVEETSANDDKENQKSSVPNHDEETSNINGEITEKPGERQSPEKKKKKPTIVNVEKVSVIFPPQVLTKSSSQSSHKDQNSSKKESSQDPIKSMSAEAEDKDLRVELQDILNDKESTKSSGSKTTKDCRKGEFGTKSNPKLLTAWVPTLLKKPGDNYGLIFEGKLLNEAGHVAARKFSTDFILRRVTPQIVETEAHEFYQLTGDLSDTKHTVPKEIQKMCLKGCPARINQFCDKWRKLIEEQIPENVNNTSIDMIGVPTSSRGRRILPPLSYWTGERVTLKDNTPIYSPGTTQESSIPSSLEMSFKKDISENSSRRKETSAKDTSMSSVLNNTNAKKNEKNEKNEKTLKKEETVKSSSKPEERSSKSKKSPAELENTKKLRSTSKRRLPRDIKNDSSDPEEIEKELRVKRRRGRRGEDKSPVKGKDERKEDSKSRENRDRRVRTRDNDARGSRSQNPKGQSSGLTCTYRLNVPYHDDVLSDDQLSTM